MYSFHVIESGRLPLGAPSMGSRESTTSCEVVQPHVVQCRHRFSSAESASKQWQKKATVGEKEADWLEFRAAAEAIMHTAGLAYANTNDNGMAEHASTLGKWREMNELEQNVRARTREKHWLPALYYELLVCTGLGQSPRNTPDRFMHSSL